MAVNFSCPECGKQLRSANPIAPGKKVKCPSCAVLFEPAAEAETLIGAVTSKPNKGPRPVPRVQDEDADRPRTKGNPDRVMAKKPTPRPMASDDDIDDDRPRSRRGRDDDYDDDDRPRSQRGRD